MKLLFTGLLYVYLCVAVNGNLENYLHDFKALKKEHIYLEKVSKSTVPSAAQFYFKIDIDGKEFHCSLQPHFDLFHPDMVVKQRKNMELKTSALDIFEFMEGTLINEPKSRVIIHIRNDIVTGSIQTSGGEKYYIEPSARHISKPHDFHMIAYKQSDIKFNITSRDEGHYCGHESHQHKNEDYSNEFHSMFPKDSGSHDKGFEYSRKRRSTSSKNRCSLALVADYLFYSNICEKDESNAMSYMVSLVQQVDALYQAQSLDPDGSDAYKGYGFQIKYVEVVTSPLTASADSDSYKYYAENHTPGVSDLLTNFAYGNWGDYCLAHLFTNHDFDSGVLGLAFIASSSTSSVGGVCTKSYTDGTGQKKYTNVGLSTTVNYGRTLLTSEVVFVTGHEFGHNWGSSHDSDSSEECAPNNNRYMMYPAAVDGSQSNNYLFSNCSKKAINDVLSAKSSLCFEEATTQLCGNGVVEEAEECDSGANSSACCSGCKLTTGSTCEDSNSECCADCKLKSIGSVCLSTDWKEVDSKHCVSEYSCNSQGKCAAGSAVPDGTDCFDSGSCKSGQCLQFCEYRGKVSCSCTQEEDMCKLCCKDTDDSSCEVYYNSSSKFNLLSDGKICGNGICVKGICEVSAQDIQEKFWEIIDEISVNMVVRWFTNNIVFAIILFTSIFWIPISMLVNWLDDKYDLGYLDEILGGDDSEKQNKPNTRGVLLGSTKMADSTNNVYPKLSSALAGTSL